ncbi:MAG: hypothetical protein Ta2B_03350 [Termitinemataceae bacterium]|nr:MAG: hypothetical protein Ta2B_03350 [Termitinemataceae bacterium]
MISREGSVLINYIIENLIPPIIRDCKWFMYPLIRAAYGKNAKHMIDFKQKSPFMRDDIIGSYYECLQIDNRNTGSYCTCF